MMALAITVLVVAHFVGDFVFQPRWMAKRKVEGRILLQHVTIYTLTLTLPAITIFALERKVLSALWFLAVNFVLHFLVDSVTAPRNARLWAEAFAKTPGAPHSFMYPPRDEPMHAFFVTIGADQMIHILCLIGTLWWLL